MKLFKKKKLKFPHIDSSLQLDILLAKNRSINSLETQRFFSKKALPEEKKTLTEASHPSFLQRINRFFLKIFTLTTFLLTFLSCFSLFILWKYGRNLPDYYFLKNYNPPVITHIYDRFGVPIHEIAEECRVYTHISDIPPILIRAFISAEDKNFYSHCGIDFQGLIKAIILNTIQKRWHSNPIGGSTITQQIAKIFLIGNEHSFTRKIKEAILAFRLENALNKDKILELYLNQIYLGLGSYGISMASQAYFHKPLQDLNIHECAFLASLPKAPSHKRSLKSYQKIFNRRNWVLKQMRKNKVISSKEYKIAKKTPLPSYSTAPLLKMTQNTYYIEEARKELIRFFGEKATYNSGLEATLTIHPHIQKLAEQSLRYALEKYDKRHGWRGPIGHIDLEKEKDWEIYLKKIDIYNLPCKPAIILNTEECIEVSLSSQKTKKLAPNTFTNTQKAQNLQKGDIVLVKKEKGKWVLTQIPQVTGGMVVLDAQTGEILALSGGYSFELSQFNCATQAFRQPGSTFKPFVYLTALENGYHENSVLVEKPITIPVSGGFYTPHNYNKHVYGGPMTLANGLIKSRNVFTVILAQKVGVHRITKLSQELGVADYIPNEICVALGASETTVLKLAGAYMTFFNGGHIIKPTLFLNVTSQFENLKMPPNISSKPVSLARKNINQIKNILHKCVIQGTGKRLKPLTEKYPIQIYGKTGTSNDFKDAWFAGCIELNPHTSLSYDFLKKSKPLVFAIFIGFPIPKSLGLHENGSKVALPAAYHFIKTLCQESK